MELQITSSSYQTSPGTRIRGRAAGSREYGLRRALDRIRRDVHSHLSSLAIVVELFDVHDWAKCQDQYGAQAYTLPAHLSRMMDEMIERAHLTGDPLPYRAGVTDVATIVSRAMQLNAPLVEKHKLDVRSDMLAPLVVAGDSRLLIEAISSLYAMTLRASAAMAEISATVRLRGGCAEIEFASSSAAAAMTCFAPALHPFHRGTNGRVQCPDDLGPWIARMIIERHGGTVTFGTSCDAKASLVARLPGRLL